MPHIMKQSIYILLIAIIIGACTEKIDVKVDSTDKRLVVEAKVTSDFKKHFVKLSESSDVFYNKTSIPITNANITVSVGTNMFDYEEITPGYYESTVEFAGDPGKVYNLSISNVDIDNNNKFESYSASAEMPEPHDVESIDIHFDSNYSNFEEEGEFFLVSIYMNDDASTDDYYGFACRINDVLVHDTITELVIIDDTYFNGENSKGADVGELDQEESEELVSVNDEICLETYSFTEDYFEFISELKQMDAEQNPLFSGPPANIRTNLSNGAMGYFAVYSITRNTVICTEDKMLEKKN